MKISRVEKQDIAVVISQRHYVHLAQWGPTFGQVLVSDTGPNLTGCLGHMSC